jgi:hypothetical protein
MPDQDKAREQFEAWFEPDESNRRSTTHLRRGDGYAPGCWYLNGCWNGWQAATAAASQDREELVEALTTLSYSVDRLGHGHYSLESREGFDAQLFLDQVRALIAKHRS